MDIQADGRSANMQIATTNARWFQLFKVDGMQIVNNKGKVLDVNYG